MALNKAVVICAYLGIVLLLAGSQNSNAQSNATATSGTSQQLFKEIYRMDSLMFDAFNKHDAEKMMTFFSDDLEFFHDKGGLDDYAETRRKSIDLFTRNANTGLRRTLVKGSMEVYPIPGYGAVETSSHKFCHKENGKDDCGTFKNIMIWKKINDQWKVSRVISYDHK